MTNFFHPPVCNIRQTLTRLTACSLALFPLVGFSMPTLADDAASLKPYSAKYVTKTHGISLNLDRKLVQKADGSYKLTNGGSKLIAGFEETSEFKQENGRIIPGSYIYQGTGLMNRRREVHFTPGADTVRSLYKDNWYDLPYTDNTFDRMSQLEQVRLLLLADDTPNETLIVTVADGKRVKDYQLDFVAEEKLETPMGVIDVVHFERLHDDPERKSDTWLAPAWDYLMVKTVHIDDGSVVEVNIVSAKSGGKALTAKQ
jgi:Protein of unknown function (DUF3108)